MTELRPQAFQAPPEVDRVQRIAGLAAVIGLVALVVGFATNAEQFYRSYLVAYLFVLGPTLGSLALMMVHYLSGGAWGLGVRRSFEAAARTLPLMVLLFLPIIVGLPHLFEWTHADVVLKDEILRHKQPYLNVNFFLVRAVIYFAVWGALTYTLTGWSKAQDLQPTPPPADAKFRIVSGPGILLYGVTVTFAAFDWMMSLDPHWFSTIYGLWFMVGQGLSALAFTTAMAFVLSRRAPMDAVLSPNKFHDYGKLLLAFTMLWAYLSYSQFLIIWSANLPEEIPWYLRRFNNGWGLVALSLVIGQFALPYCLLLSRDLKRRASRLAALAIFVFLMRYVDLYWNVAPQFNGGRFAFHWLDLAAPIGLLGLWVTVYCWNLKGRALLPVGDPYLEEALADGH